MHNKPLKCLLMDVQVNTLNVNVNVQPERFLVLFSAFGQSFAQRGEHLPLFGQNSTGDGELSCQLTSAGHAIHEARLHAVSTRFNCTLDSSKNQHNLVQSIRRKFDVWCCTCCFESSPISPHRWCGAWSSTPLSGISSPPPSRSVPSCFSRTTWERRNDADSTRVQFLSLWHPPLLGAPQKGNLKVMI